MTDRTPTEHCLHETGLTAAGINSPSARMRRGGPGVRAVLAAVLLTVASYALGADAMSNRLTEQTNFNIPAQPLGAALKQLADQAGIQILFEEQVVSGLQAPAIRTHETPIQALNALLKGTGLEFVAKDRTIAVRRKAAATALSTTEEPDQSAGSNSVTEKRTAGDTGINLAQADIRTPSSGPEGSNSSDKSATEASSETSESKKALQEVVVTGTRRTDRTVTQSMVPVDVFTSKDIQQQSSSDMNTILRTLVPSFEVSRFATADTTAFVRAPTLRGLPPDEILVQINGKRDHRSALVQLNGGALALGAQGADIAQIPAIAVERIEVLRDGAAAQYGSDAIAGVINFGLKKNRDGLELNARVGRYYRGDGLNRQVDANLGLPVGSNGFFDVSAEYVDADQTERGGVRPSAAALEAARPDLIPLIPSPPMRVGDPRLQAGKVFINSGADVGPGNLYFFGNYGYTQTAIDFNYRQSLSAVGPDRFGTGSQLFSRAAAFNTIYLDQTTPGSNVYDVNGRTFDYASWFPGGFTPRFRGESYDMSGTGGYKDTLSSGLSYDVSASYGRNQLKLFIDNTVNPSLGADSPRNFYLGSLTQIEQNLNADFTDPIEIGLASPMTFAFGAERRQERYVISAGDPASYAVGPYSYQTLNGENPDPEITGNFATQSAGANGFPGYSQSSAVDHSRISYAAYADLEADVLRNLSLGLAGRYEHFADFGSTTNYKISGRYAFNDVVAFRAAASSGFRAPTPGQLFTTNIATNFQGANLVETATLPPTNAAAEFFGARPLKPEKSKNYSAGFVVTPGFGFTTTLDFYQIDVRDRLGLSGQFAVTTEAQRLQLQQLGVADFATLGYVQYFTNAFSTQTRGADLVVSHLAPTVWGTFTTTLSTNFNATEVTSRNTLPVNGVPTLIIDDVRKGNIEHLRPKVRSTLTENWSRADWSFLVRLNYASSFTAYDTVANGGNLTLSPQTTADLEVSYEMFKNFRVAAGGENVFNSYPDRNIRSLGLPNQNLYVATDTTINAAKYVDDSPFGYDGGFWYLRASMKF
jgi:iron complex outermembrane receptor protein